MNIKKEHIILCIVLILIIVLAVLDTSNNQTKTGITLGENKFTKEDIERDLIGPLNGKKITKGAPFKHYSFFVAGHTYGSYDHKKSVYTSSSLLANLNKINNSKASFFISLGDNFRLYKEPYISRFKYGFVDQLDIPLFNAVGNHDVDFGRDKYSMNFGPTYYSFTLGSEMYIIMDTDGQNSPHIMPEELKFVKEKLSEAKRKSSIKNVFIFTHKLIWAEAGYDYFVIVHNRTNISNTNNYFRNKLYPSIKEVAATKNVFIGSGDVGHLSHPVFYHYKEDDRITYFATGINDAIQDCMVEITINNGQVSFQAISLTGQPVLPIENYGLELWSTRRGWKAP